MKITIVKAVKVLTVAAVLSAGSLAGSAAVSAESPQPQPTETTNKPTKKQTVPAPSKNKNIVGDMKKLASKATEAQQLIQYMNKHIHKVSPAQADEMYVILEKYYVNHNDHANMKLDEWMQNRKLYAQMEKLGSNMNQFHKMKDKSLKKWLITQQKGKLKLSKDGAHYFLRTDYRAILDSYSSAFSKDTVFYLNQRTLYSDELYYVFDDAKKPSYQTLIKRAHAIDEYTKKTPTSKNKAKLLDIHHGYLYQFFHKNWDDVIDKKTGKIQPKMKKAYMGYLEKYGKSRTGSILQHYVDLIEKNNDVLLDSKGNPLPYYQKFWDEEYAVLYKKTFK